MSALELSRAIREHASTLFREAQAADLIRGRSIEALAAGSVYGACRVDGVIRTIEEVAATARCDQGMVLLGYRVLNSELGIASRPLSAGDVLPRLLAAVDATTAIRSRAIELVGFAHDNGFANGRAPSGVAAGCLYLASREMAGALTQEQIAAEAGVTPVTLRERYQELDACEEIPSTP